MRKKAKSRDERTETKDSKNQQRDTQEETDKKSNSERKEITQTATDSNKWCRTNNINDKNPQGNLDRQTQVQENKTIEDD